MAAEHVTQWLKERKPAATILYEGPDGDGIHRWRLDFPGDATPFALGVAAAVLQNEGMLAERLMELDNQGYLDQAGEEEQWVLLTAMEVAREPGLWE